MQQRDRNDALLVPDALVMYGIAGAARRSGSHAVVLTAGPVLDLCMHHRAQYDVHPVYLRRPADAPPDEPEPGPQDVPRYELELTCNGMVRGSA